MSIASSSLASKVDRSALRLRPSSTQDNWGGDETVSLGVKDIALKCRIEWGEGTSARWDIWCFVDTDIKNGDIFLFEDLDLAVIVDRVGMFTTLRGEFHHFELITSEHEKSVAELKTEAGI